MKTELKTELFSRIIVDKPYKVFSKDKILYKVFSI